MVLRRNPLDVPTSPPSVPESTDAARTGRALLHYSRVRIPLSRQQGRPVRVTQHRFVVAGTEHQSEDTSRGKTTILKNRAPLRTGCAPDAVETCGELWYSPFVRL